MEQMDLILAGAALLVSMYVAADKIAARNKTEAKSWLKDARDQIDSLRSFRDRVDGANVLERLTKVEVLQRADENALIRIEEKLQAVESILTTLAEEIREIGKQDAT